MQNLYKSIKIHGISCLPTSLDEDSRDSPPDIKSFLLNTVRNNTAVIANSPTNSDILLYLEALAIKFQNPELNTGLKASRDLVLFWLF